MYEQFYKFSAEPFRLSPDHAFAYAHKGYTKAKAYMTYAFMRAEGFVMITGRPGTGKTTLIGALLEGLAKQDVNVANLVCTQLKADDLLKMVAYEFGVSPSVVEKGELLQRLTHQFRAWHRDGHRALLVVDEAQDLSISAMEELRLLTNIQVDSRPLLQIFLLGQPELRELILTPALEQIHQRIIAASHLQPLESDETEAYIRHRLQTVGWQGDPLISAAVYPLVFKFSEGVPRRINLICSRLLLHCAVEQRHRIGVADVREIIQELQHENLAAGTRFSECDFQVADVFDDELIPEQRRNDPADLPLDKGQIDEALVDEVLVDEVLAEDAFADNADANLGSAEAVVAADEAANDTAPDVVEPIVDSPSPEVTDEVCVSRDESAGDDEDSSRREPAEQADTASQERPLKWAGQGQQRLKVIASSAAVLPLSAASAAARECQISQSGSSGEHSSQQVVAVQAVPPALSEKQRKSAGEEDTGEDSAEKKDSELTSPMSIGSDFVVAPGLDSDSAALSQDMPDIPVIGQIVTEDVSRKLNASGSWSILGMLLVSILLVVWVVLGSGGNG